MKRTHSMFTLFAILFFATTVFAHEGREHITGTVIRVEKSRVEVKGVDGKSITVALTASTIYTKGKERAAAADVKPGTHVDVDAMKGKAGLEAVEVRVWPAEASYTCPMHPEVAQPEPGKCPKCGMNLEKKKG